MKHISEIIPVCVDRIIEKYEENQACDEAEDARRSDELMLLRKQLLLPLDNLRKEEYTGLR